MRRFLPALAWAAVLAIATWPVRQWLIDKGMWTSTAAIALALLVGVLIVGPIVALAIQMAREAVVIVEAVRNLRESGLGSPEWVPQLPLVVSCRRGTAFREARAPHLPSARHVA